MYALTSGHIAYYMFGLKNHPNLPVQTAICTLIALISNDNSRQIPDSLPR